MKAIIFDLDGTLVNSLEDLKDATNFAMEGVGLPKRSLEEVRTFIGNGVDMLVKRALEEENIDKYSRAIELFREYYGKNMCNKTKAYEGINELLDTLISRGYVCAVVSNKPDGPAKNVVDYYFGNKIKVTVGTDLEKRPKKPAPDGVFLALEMLGIDKTEAIYVGDSDVDVATGKNANMAVIGVLWGFRNREALKGADFIVEKPMDILDCI